MSEFNWSFPEDGTSLSQSEVHIWRVWLNQELRSLPNHEVMLSPDELKVASKFFFDRDRNRYIVGRGTLRSILARYLDIHPQKILIVQGQYGKPLLDNNPQQIEFNLSHSQNLALFAFTIGHQIGIDVESILPIPDFENTARTFLSSNEMKAFLQLPDEIRLHGFYSVWTRKEALSKALGVGIGNALEKLEISIAPNEKPTLKETHRVIVNGSDWHLLDLRPAPDFIATLAIDCSEFTLRLLDFPPTS
jgi:4'-phosphopantetheinyl transferase